MLCTTNVGFQLLIFFKILLNCICKNFGSFHLEISQSCQDSSKLSCQPEETGLIPYGLWSGRYEENDITIDEKKNACYGGIPINYGSCICYFNSAGVYCCTDVTKSNSRSLNNLQWKVLSNHICPHRNVACKDNIVEEQFVVTSSGHAEVDLSTSENDTETIYRFKMISNKESGKSRLELSTCFMHENRLIETFGSPVLDFAVGTALITHCPVANLGANLLHIYKYELFLPRKYFQATQNYILTQWHGTADPNILKDQNGCIARVTDSDRHKLCVESSCKQGQICSKLGNPSGLTYQHGGYPPLSFHVRDGSFFVTARSDDRIFIPKGGCGSKKSGQLCPQHPRQQRHDLIEIPFEKFKFDEWVQFEWRIVWSEYAARKMTKSENQDPGILLSNAWIQLFIAGELVIDWVGPCGRNDEGRIPFFKIGMYKPCGDSFSAKYYMKKFAHNWKPIQSISTQSEKQKLITLKIRKKPKNVFSNFNSLSNNMKFKKVRGSCKLKTPTHHLAGIDSIKLNHLEVDDQTRRTLNAIMKVLKEQNERILNLEKRVKQCEDFFNGDDT